MRVIIQRVNNASVEVDDKLVGKIDAGYVIFVCFTYGDTLDDLSYIVNKIKFIRLFDDDNGIMNIDINNIKGSILSISQFTLYANTSKGRRPSYEKALKFDDSKKLYDLFNEMLRNEGLKVAEGIFGADMKVSLINDGPITIILDSKGDSYEKSKL